MNATRQSAQPSYVLHRGRSVPAASAFPQCPQGITNLSLIAARSISLVRAASFPRSALRIEERTRMRSMLSVDIVRASSLNWRTRTCV
jgi:hypothetical protein